MNLKDLYVGDLVKFNGDLEWEWLKTESEIEAGTGDNSNVGIVTQISAPESERMMLISSDFPQDLLINADEAVRDRLPAIDRARADKIQNLCFIYHLTGEGTVRNPYNLESSTSYEFRDGSSSESDAAMDVEKLSHEEFKRFKLNLTKREVRMQNDLDAARGLVEDLTVMFRNADLRQLEVSLQPLKDFSQLIIKYANDPPGDPDTTSSSSGMSTRKKAMIGAAGLAGIGGVALGNYLTGGKKKKRKTKRKKTKRRRTKRRRTKKKKY
jgi:hypothetical protein